MRAEYERAMQFSRHIAGELPFVKELSFAALSLGAGDSEAESTAALSETLDLALYSHAAFIFDRPLPVLAVVQCGVKSDPAQTTFAMFLGTELWTPVCEYALGVDYGLPPGGTMSYPLLGLHGPRHAATGTFNQVRLRLTNATPNHSSSFEACTGKFVFYSAARISVLGPSDNGED